MSEVYQDVVVATMRGADVLLRFPDASTADVPQHTLARSMVLSQAVASIGKDDRVSINVPKGVIASWLQCVSALDVQSSCDGVEDAEHAPAGTKGDISNGSRLLEFVKVGYCYLR